MTDAALALLRSAYDADRGSGSTTLSFEAWCRSFGIVANWRHGWDDASRRTTIHLGALEVHDDGEPREIVALPIVPDVTKPVPLSPSWRGWIREEEAA